MLDSELPLQAELQARIGLMPKVHTRQLGGRRVLYSQVSSLSEITRLVRASRTLGLRLRAGAGAECLTADDLDVIVDTDFIADQPAIETFKIDNERFVTVKPGVTVRQFNEFCLSHDLCLPACPDMPNARLIDLATTGCSGHSPGQPAVSDFLETIRIVDADGRLRAYRSLSDQASAEQLDEKRREEKQRLFAGAQCHLGLFGLVYDATFRVEKNFTVKIETKFAPLEETLLNGEALAEMARSNQTVSVYWFPFNSVRGPDDPPPPEEEEEEEEAVEEKEEEEKEEVVEEKENEEDEKEEEEEQKEEQAEQEAEEKDENEEEEKEEEKEEAEEEEELASPPPPPTPPPELYTLDEWRPERDQVFCRFTNASQTLSEPKAEFDLIDPDFIDPSTGSLTLSDPVDTVDILRRTHRRHRQQQPQHSERHQHASWGLNWVKSSTYPAGLSSIDYSVDAGQNFSNAVACVELVAARVAEYKRRGQFPLNCCLCASFAAASAALMAPSHCAHAAKGGTGVTCQLKFLLFPEDPDGDRGVFEEFARDLEMDLRGVEGARPHWMTNWAFVEGTHAMLKKVYQQDLEQFKAMIREKLVDLDGVFLNRHLAKVVESDDFECQQKYALKNRRAKDSLAGDQ